MVKATPGKQQNQNKRRQLFTASICNVTRAPLSAQNKTRAQTKQVPARLRAETRGSNLPGAQPCLGLPAVLSLQMTQSKGANVLQK